MSQLDNKIKVWANAYIPTAINAQKKPTQIMQLLAEQQRLSKRAMPAPRQRLTRVLAFAVPALCAVACAVVFAFAGLTARPSFLLQKKEVAQIKNECVEFERLFPEGLRYSQSDNGRSEIDVGDARRASPAVSSGRVLLAYDMIHKQHGRVLTRTRKTFVIWGEEPVELKGALANSLWIQKVDTDKLYISLNMTVEYAACQFHVQNDYLQAIGVAQMIASHKNGEETCECYQTAYVL